jgi:hypothetical protein
MISVLIFAALGAASAIPRGGLALAMRVLMGAGGAATLLHAFGSAWIETYFGHTGRFYVPEFYLGFYFTWIVFGIVVGVHLIVMGVYLLHLLTVKQEPPSQLRDR